MTRFAATIELKADLVTVKIGCAAICLTVEIAKHLQVEHDKQEKMSR